MVRSATHSLADVTEGTSPEEGRICATDGADAVTPEDPKAARWAELLRRDVPQDQISIYTLSGIASAQVLVEALRRTGPDLTAESFKATLDRRCGRVTDLYMGDICFTPEDPQGNKTGAWIKLDRGKVVNVGTKFPTSR